MILLHTSIRLQKNCRVTQRGGALKMQDVKMTDQVAGREIGEQVSF